MVICHQSPWVAFHELFGSSRPEPIRSHIKVPKDLNVNPQNGTIYSTLKHLITRSLTVVLAFCDDSIVCYPVFFDFDMT